uniref:Uncharacterized protein n=1 Tax=Alexandrium monilatum TaxID=311494 RepID=A0A7S4VX47_9DINO
MALAFWKRLCLLEGGCGAAAPSAGTMVLTHVLDNDFAGSTARVALLTVHVLGADVPQSLAGQRLKVRVKYGEHLASRCETDLAVVCPEGRLQIGTACCFLAELRRKPVVRFDLIRRALFTRGVGRASLGVPDRGQPAAGLKRLRLSDEGFGDSWLNVHTEIHYLRKGDLQRLLRLLGARRQLGAFSLPLPMQGNCEGSCEATPDSCEETQPVQGIAVSRGGLWGLRATLAF